VRVFPGDRRRSSSIVAATEAPSAPASDATIATIATIGTTAAEHRWRGTDAAAALGGQSPPWIPGQALQVFLTFNVHILGNDFGPWISQLHQYEN